MHEFNIIASIFPVINQTAQQHDLKKVNTVFLEIGELRQCIPDFLQFAFATLAKDTIAAGADLKIKLIPIKMCCKTCNKEFVVHEQTFICPHCENTDLELITGKEFILASLDGET